MGKTAVLLGDREFPIEKPSAAQVLTLTQLFSRSFLKARGVLLEEFDITQPADFDFIFGFLLVLEPEDLIKLSALLLQTDDVEFVEANFDLGIVVEAFQVWAEQAGLGELLKNLVSATQSFGVAEQPPEPKKRRGRTKGKGA